MSPHAVLHDFLPDSVVAGLLEHATAHKADFRPMGIGRSSEPRFDASIRSSQGMRDLGLFKSEFIERFRAVVADVTESFQLTKIATPKLEIELVAHGDGAFYKRHKDTRTGTQDASVRVLSSVFYFHGLPKAFSGGALRLYTIGGEGFLDIEPQYNKLVLFPSWVPHEVRPVACPSGRFADSRFSVNCWVRRSKPIDKAPDGQ